MMRIPACVIFAMPKGEQIRWFTTVVEATEADGETAITSPDRLQRLLVSARPEAVSVMLLADGWGKDAGDREDDAA
ncbi:hypothetical protein [Bifidobacterium reuteri]|uniref:hypothetical protein n=1 Tax=Bifidobacterium reuteri TaxID=983706 RepID=UPI0005C4E118|nr:hypothetical protein [Bifidobacterium reuteri]